MFENRRIRSQGFGIQNNGMYRVFSKYKFMGLFLCPKHTIALWVLLR